MRYITPYLRFAARAKALNLGQLEGQAGQHTFEMMHKSGAYCSAMPS